MIVWVGLLVFGCWLAHPLLMKRQVLVSPFSCASLSIEREGRVVTGVGATPETTLASRQISNIRPFLGG